MKREAFRFKQFSITDQNSALKVNSDAVLLGAWANIKNKGNLLDIGTGCGILALMAAQKANIPILGIDNHEGSVIDAKQNFAQSPWSSQLTAKCISIQEFADDCKLLFHQIISNPPFFVNSLKSPFEDVNQSKHTPSLSQEELLSASIKLLHPKGRFFIILPTTEGKLFEDKLPEFGLYLNNKTEVRPREGKPLNRLLMEISKIKKKQCVKTELLIRKADGSFTHEYKQLCADYYPGF